MSSELLRQVWALMVVAVLYVCQTILFCIYFQFSHRSSREFQYGTFVQGETGALVTDLFSSRVSWLSHCLCWHCLVLKLPITKFGLFAWKSEVHFEVNWSCITMADISPIVTINCVPACVWSQYPVPYLSHINRALVRDSFKTKKLVQWRLFNMVKTPGCLLMLQKTQKRYIWEESNLI